MFARAQTPRPPGKAGRYECIRRACEPSEPPDGWCGREARRSERGGAARRVSCVLWTLETLARSGGGGGPHPWRERWARGRAYRGGSGRMQRGFCRRCGGAWPGGDSRRVRGDAFLVSFGHSKRLRGAGAGRPAPMARAVGAGTRLPRRERAHATGLLTGGAKEHGPAGTAAGCGETRFLRLSGARNARAASVRRKDGPCHSERRVGMGPARKRAATKPIPRTARAAAHGGRTCEPTRKEGSHQPCSD